jgi:hypothetical protein
MRFGKLMKQLKTSSKTPAQYLEEDILSEPYKDVDFNTTAKALEMGVSSEELTEILNKKKALKQAMERLKMKQEK